MNKKTNTTTGDQKPIPKVMSELYVILIGLSFGFGTQELVESFSFELFLRFITLCAILLIWLHSQLSVADRESYKIVKNLFFSLADHYLDTISAILLVSASLLLKNPLVFYILIIASYAVDVLVECLNLLKIRKSKEQYKRDRELSWTWIIINLVTMIFLTIFAFCQKLTNQYISLATLIVVLIGNLIDYLMCRDFYFGLKRIGKKVGS